MDQYFIYEIINIVFSSTGMILSFFGLVFSLSFKYMQKAYRAVFIIFFSILLAYATSNVIFLVSVDLLDESFVFLSKLSLFIESFFSASLMPFITITILLITSKKAITSKMLWAEISLFFIYVVLLIITQFTTFIYYFTPDNEYHRGPYYPLLLVPPVLMMILNLIFLFINRANISRKNLFYFTSYTAIPLICMIIQIALYGIQFIVIGTTIASFLMFRAALSEQLMLYVKQQDTLAKQKTDIMLLQMRPHFIYNTMSSIYYLCAQDPKKAQTLVGDFTSYLRKNMSAIATHELIPFSEELEHTRAYLAVEKARYEKLLFVDY
jgi:sensor histidine kinase YesM